MAALDRLGVCAEQATRLEPPAVVPELDPSLHAVDHVGAGDARIRASA